VLEEAGKFAGDVLPRSIAWRRTWHQAGGQQGNHRTGWPDAISAGRGRWNAVSGPEAFGGQACRCDQCACTEIWSASNIAFALPAADAVAIEALDAHGSDE